MPSVPFTPALKSEYESLFNLCVIRPASAAIVEAIIKKILENKNRYQKAADSLDIPWFFIAVIHNMESSLDFNKHLHNGDPLTQRTFHVPAGRPANGTPPFTWEVSAIDALSMRKLGAATDWSLAGVLYQLEAYNGWGYRLKHPEVKSPYLWSFSNHYSSGKYIADGTWSDTAVSKQCGAAVLLRRMVELGYIEFIDQPAPAHNSKPLVVSYSNTKSKVPKEVSLAGELQRWLNTFPGIFVKVDGIPGKRTSEAYKKVTGKYLPGDPRG